MKVLGLLVSFILTSFVSAQIEVSKAGDGWDHQVDSAINLIKTYDYEKFQTLKLVCSKVDFWLGPHSSCTEEKGKGIILIAISDVSLKSINNLAAILVHESLHLMIMKRSSQMNSFEEEKLCYSYELSFLNKLPNPEPWLLEHTKEQIRNNTK